VTAAELQASRRRRRVALETYEAQAIFGLGNDGILAAIAANGGQIQNIRRREKNRIGIWTHSLVETPGPNPVGVAPTIHPKSRVEVLEMTVPQIAALRLHSTWPLELFLAPRLKPSVPLFSSTC